MDPLPVVSVARFPSSAFLGVSQDSLLLLSVAVAEEGAEILINVQVFMCLYCF